MSSSMRFLRLFCFTLIAAGLISPFSSLLQAQTSETLPTPTAVATINDPALLPHAVTVTPDRTTTVYTLDADQLQQEVFKPLLLAPKVTFYADHIQVSGDRDGSPVEITISPQIKNEKLYFKITDLVINGTNARLTSSRSDLQKELDDSTNDIQFGLKVESLVIIGNSLQLDVLGLPPRRSGSGLDAQNQALLDRAAHNSLAASSLRFSFYSQIRVALDDQEGNVMASGDGVLHNYADLQSFEMQVKVTLTADLPDKHQEIEVEERVTQGVFYMRGTNPANRMCTRWISVPMSAVFDDVFIFVDQLVPVSALLDSDSGAVATPEADTMSAVLGLMDLSDFFETSRIDSSGDEAQFRTRVDIERLLSSSDTLESLLTLLSRLNGIDLKGKAPAAVAKMLVALRPLFLPEAELSIDRYVDLTHELISRIDFRTHVSVLPFNPQELLKHQLTSLAQPAEVDIAATVGLSDYNAEVSVAAPDHPLAVDSLDGLARLSRNDVLTTECD